MLESKIVKQIKDYLAGEGYAVFKYYGSAYGVKGFADLFGVCPDGRAFFIEVKQPGKLPTVLQTLFLERMRKYGAIAVWTNSVEMTKKLLANYPLN